MRNTNQLKSNEKRLHRNGLYEIIRKKGGEQVDLKISELIKELKFD